MFAWILLHSNGYRNIKSRSWLGTIHLTESGCILLPKMNVRSNPSSGDWVLLATPLLTISSKFYFSPTRQTNGKQKVWTAYFNSSHPHESSNTLKVVPLVGDISQAKILRLLPTMVSSLGPQTICFFLPTWGVAWPNGGHFFQITKVGVFWQWTWGNNVQEIHKYVQVEANFWEDFRASTFDLTSEDVHLKHFNSQGNL